MIRRVHAPLEDPPKSRDTPREQSHGTELEAPMARYKCVLDSVLIGHRRLKSVSASQCLVCSKHGKSQAQNLLKEMEFSRPNSRGELSALLRRVSALEAPLQIPSKQTQKEHRIGCIMRDSSGLGLAQASIFTRQTFLESGESVAAASGIERSWIQTTNLSIGAHAVGVY